MNLGKRLEGLNNQPSATLLRLCGAGKCAASPTLPFSYNRRFPPARDAYIMEAERLNSLSALLADLTTREAELRRYL